jgi:hypothetical protein
VPILPQQRQETLIMSGDNDPVVPLANATAGCAAAAILPQDAGQKALHNRGAWPIHGDRTLVEPTLRMGVGSRSISMQPVYIRAFCAASAVAKQTARLGLGGPLNPRTNAERPGAHTLA